jgi:hypothetical protein
MLALRWPAMAGIGLSLLIMIAVSAARHSWAVPQLPRPAVGPPWVLGFSLPVPVVTIGLWAAGLLGSGGVIAGLVAVARGARFPLWLLIGGAFVAVAVLTVLPPAGSTDALDYAAYGRMVVLGHTPYVMTPAMLRHIGDPIGLATPQLWRNSVSLYGPLATIEQAGAALLGGTSALRIVFWLKLCNAVAFGAVAFILDRMVRTDPARRIRAHLLWTVNPLLLWNLIAAGHLDGFAAGVGFLGLAMFSCRPGETHPGPLRALAAGLLVGMAVDIKISLAMFGLGLLWASRRSLRIALISAMSALAVIVPSYAWFGPPAVTALLSHSGMASADSYYQLFDWAFGHRGVPIMLVVLPVLFAVAALLLMWLPDITPGLPAIQPVMALSLAWLFIWPYEFPWYDAMIFCLLALYPVSRLDWLLVGRLSAATIALMPGNPLWSPPAWLTRIAQALLSYVVPGLLLVATAVLVWLCLTRTWRIRSPDITRQAELLTVP